MGDGDWGAVQHYKHMAFGKVALAAHHEGRLKVVKRVCSEPGGAEWHDFQAGGGIPGQGEDSQVGMAQQRERLRCHGMQGLRCRKGLPQSQHAAHLAPCMHVAAA